MSELPMKEQLVENFEHVLDETTPWFEWLSYCECCKSLDAPGQPSYGRFLRYHEYLKQIGLY